MLPNLCVLVAVAAGIIQAAPSSGFDSATPPFLQQLDNQTWMIGNGIWNVTQQVTYGVQLYYKGQDCVGDAVGHYVSYSTFAQSLSQPRVTLWRLTLFSKMVPPQT